MTTHAYPIDSPLKTATERGFAKIHTVDEAAAAFQGKVASEKGRREEADGEYHAMLRDLRATFRSGVTKKLEWRKQQLRQLILLFTENADAIMEAIHADLGGSHLRGVFDMGAVEQARLALASLDAWAKDESVSFGSALGSSYVRREPKGVVLNISPWNFPVNLALDPLVAILAAGNCAVLKPSELSPASEALLARLVPQYLDASAVRVVTGGAADTTALLEMRWDHILYTGNGSVGRLVMAAAARHLTPVTLELGGKSPVIVAKSANISLAAKRIALGKWFANAGQVCISPDYVLCDEAVEAPLLAALANELKATVGEGRVAHGVDCSAEDEGLCAFGRIINGRHVERISALLDGCGGKTVFGDASQIDAAARYVPPMLISRPDHASELLKQEIFGPILPVVAVPSVDVAIARVREICETPLALYVFTEDGAEAERVLTAIPSGGASVNTTMEHALAAGAPFGGVGASGMGSYHGKFGFDEFSHKRSVLYRTTKVPITFIPFIELITGGRVPKWLGPLALMNNVTGFVGGWVVPSKVQATLKAAAPVAAAVAVAAVAAAYVPLN